MNGFSHYAVSIGQFYYFLKRINVFTYEQAAFGSVYLSLKDHKLVDDKAFEIINEAFENAKNGVCKLEKCSIKHDQIEKPYKKFCFDFLFNLVLQIGAYSIYSDGVDAQFLTDSVERLKEEAKYYLENVIEGIPIELPDIDAYSFVPNKIIDALRDDQLFDKISGFSFFECDEEAKYIGHYVDDILGKKEYAIGISYFDDYEKAYPLIELSARKGYSHGISSLGSYYRNGVVVEKDIKKAISLYEQAVSKGSSFACYQLARIYESVNGVSIDKDKSNDYYEKSYYYAMHGICRDDIYSNKIVKYQ